MRHSYKVAAAVTRRPLIVGGLLLATAVIAAALVLGAEQVSAMILPWLMLLSLAAWVIVVGVLLPLAILRATREVSRVGLLVASYVVGTTCWMMGLLLTLEIWGYLAAFLGLLVLGVGVVPIAMLATLRNGMSDLLFALVLLTVLTFVCRIVAHLLAEST